jgi:hypothetical protein
LNEALLPDVGLPNGQRSTTAIDIAADGIWRRLSKDNVSRKATRCTAD